MDYNQTLRIIHSHSSVAYASSLKRIKAVMPLIGNPHEKLKFIHIGGTNGKGSVSAMLAGILCSSGYKTGLFTSPYVEDFCERMQINGIMIPHEKLSRYTEKLEQILIQSGLSLNEFEFITALALMWFYDERCRVVILEVGLGGEFDPTNVIENTLFSVITSLSLDHMKVLGDTEEKIAACKAGIIKQNGNLILSRSVRRGAAEIFERRAKEKNCRITVPDLKDTVVKYKRNGSSVLCGNTEYELSMLGKSQYINLLTVLEGVKLLRSYGFNISDYTAAESIKKTRLAARAEIFSCKGRDVILDGGHNEESICNLAGLISLHRFKTPCTVVFASMADKDYKKSLEVLSGITGRIIFTSAGGPRGENPDRLFAEAEKYNWSREVIEDPREAVNSALQSDTQTAVICGSFYLAGQVRKLLSATE